MLIVNTCMASTMVMGVNHVNLSTKLKNLSANTNARVSYPVNKLVFQGPLYVFKRHRSDRVFSLEGCALEGLGAYPQKPCYGCYACYEK